MNGILSAFLGFIFTALLFALCFFVVIGVKFFIVTVKSYVKKPQPQPTPQKEEKPSAPKKPRRKFKTIEINPDEVDRIFVRK